MLSVSSRARKRRYGWWERISLLLLLLLGIYLLLNSSLFSIKEVRVAGNKKVATKEILEAAHLRQGENIFKVNLEEVAQRVATLPQIAEAQVKRLLPHTVLIEVKERELVALLPGKDGFYGVDLTGHCLGRYSVDLPFPVLTGVGEAPPPGKQISDAGFFLLKGLLAALKQAGLLEKIGEIHLNISDRTIEAYTTEGVKIYLGTPAEVKEKVDILARLLPMLKAGEVEYVDLQVASRPVVRFKGGDRQSAHTSPKPTLGRLDPGTDRGRANAPGPGDIPYGSHPAH
ncbi:Polypeptide-transport-associated domain protein FtsQ-type [Ammonifex degensii KC4]|uniref:Polypeptide-transport-associated domain protein FtsQ-type n=1 Tax=Ammonifex degensii (strain DSM 10501 / KC4) TaxID=429009 RepID=C9R8M5_AMMDK|nr:FtsQ-type POTRA domain-containing protein [Ammonifex degensii]ACX52654.1 Polypeptide-transport-associated domain protein FtsQ-type [Ammonifex degensii KC4]